MGLMESTMSITTPVVVAAISLEERLTVVRKGDDTRGKRTETSTAMVANGLRRKLGTTNLQRYGRHITCRPNGLGKDTHFAVGTPVNGADDRSRGDILLQEGRDAGRVDAVQRIRERSNRTVRLGIVGIVGIIGILGARNRHSRRRSGSR
jgi:hypothetical protein